MTNNVDRTGLDVELVNDVAKTIFKSEHPRTVWNDYPTSYKDQVIQENYIQTARVIINKVLKAKGV